MESARWRIMETGTPRDQVVLILGMNQSSNWEVRKDIPEELGKILAEGDVPADFVPEVVVQVGVRLDQLAPECAKIALDAVKRDDIAWDLQYRIIGSIGQGAASVRRGKGAVPGWVDEVEQLGWEKTTDETLPPNHRERWLEMHLYASADSSSKVRELILDGQQPTWLRASAAELLPSFDRKSSIYSDLLPVFDQIDPEIKLGLARSASQSPEAPGSEDLYIAVIRDQSIPAGRRSSVFPFHPTLQLRSEKVRDALTKLQDDPAMKSCASQLLAQIK